MLDIGTRLRYYKRTDIQEEMVLHASDKEVAVRYGDKGYGKRPDVLKYPKDVIELAKNGATSFHASEEIWHNPLQLDPGLRKEELETLRKGWDLVIDIDCKHWAYSKIIADLTIKALKHHNITAVSAKFSGNKGFHIGVPFEAFPERIAGEDVSKRFPEDIREIAMYIKGMIQNIFASKIIEMEHGDIEVIAKNLYKEIKDLVVGKTVDAGKLIDIDTVLISSRHLYRMPYSLHEKSGLASIPIDPDKILEFEREMAKPENVVVNKEFRFLDRENILLNQAKELFDVAIYRKKDKESVQDMQRREERPMEIPESAIPSQFFPPCVYELLEGISDGKKRGMFILINFLTSVGWSHEQIEKFVIEWNKKNPEPLKEVLIVGHLRYHKQQKKKVMPPNCQNQGYYKDIGICKPDNLCSKIKNPVQYAKRKVYYNSGAVKKKEKEE